MKSKKRLTTGELQNIPQDDIAQEDKELIEKCVLEHGGGYEESLNIELRQGIRAYLVTLCFEQVLDDELRGEFPNAAATFADGWQYSRA